MHPAISSSLPKPSRGSPASSIVHYLQRSAIFLNYQRAFEISTGLPLALRQPGSFQFPIQGSRRTNPFYVLAARTNRWCAPCLQFEESLEHAARNETTTMESHTGLTESAVPVRVGEKLIGHLRTGQVFLQRPSKKRFERLVEEMGTPGADLMLTELKAAYFQTPVMPARQYASALRLLTIFAQHLSAVTNQVILNESKAEIPAITKARAFMEQHLTEAIRLPDVARAASVSEFYFCKLFRRITGLTFTQYLARIRVEAAKTALQNPRQRICEAAYASGFQSLSQFNRVFSRVAGVTPTKYREHIRSLVPSHHFQS